MSKWVGDYNLRERIGKGSFADVYLSVHRSNAGRYAIKAISKDILSEPKLLLGLESEIRIMKDFEHQNIVRLFEHFSSEKNLYLVLELCAGGDLNKYIRKRKRLPEKVAQNFLLQLANGLCFLQGKGYLHRDLKPANVLLSESSDDAVLKLADFGFARHLGSVGLAQTRCGTPLYMAPEILESREYDGKADVWSIGCIFHEMLVGTTPYSGTSEGNLLRNIRTTEISVPKDVQMSRPTVEVLSKLLRRTPSRRASLDQLQQLANYLVTAPHYGAQEEVEADSAITSAAGGGAGTAAGPSGAGAAANRGGSSSSVMMDGDLIDRKNAAVGVNVHTATDAAIVGAVESRAAAQQGRDWERNRERDRERDMVGGVETERMEEKRLERDQSRQRRSQYPAASTPYRSDSFYRERGSASSRSAAGSGLASSGLATQERDSAGGVAVNAVASAATIGVSIGHAIASAFVFSPTPAPAPSPAFAVNSPILNANSTSARRGSYNPGSRLSSDRKSSTEGSGSYKTIPLGSEAATWAGGEGFATGTGTGTGMGGVRKGSRIDASSRYVGEKEHRHPHLVPASAPFSFSDGNAETAAASAEFYEIPGHRRSPPNSARHYPNQSHHHSQQAHPPHSSLSGGLGTPIVSTSGAGVSASAGASLIASMGLMGNSSNSAGTASDDDFVMIDSDSSGLRYDPHYFGPGPGPGFGLGLGLGAGLGAGSVPGLEEFSHRKGSTVGSSDPDPNPDPGPATGRQQAGQTALGIGLVTIDGIGAAGRMVGDNLTAAGAMRRGSGEDGVQQTAAADVALLQHASSGEGDRREPTRSSSSSSSSIESSADAPACDVYMYSLLRRCEVYFKVVQSVTVLADELASDGSREVLESGAADTLIYAPGPEPALDIGAALPPFTSLPLLDPAASIGVESGFCAEDCCLSSCMESLLGANSLYLHALSLLRHLLRSVCSETIVSENACFEGTVEILRERLGVSVSELSERAEVCSRLMRVIVQSGRLKNGAAPPPGCAFPCPERILYNAALQEEAHGSDDLLMGNVRIASRRFLRSLDFLDAILMTASDAEDQRLLQVEMQRVLGAFEHCRALWEDVEGCCADGSQDLLLL